MIEVGSLDAFFDDEPGYRISTDTSALPEIRFEADEAAVLGIAARAWEQATLARRTTEAMRKLTAQGVEVDAARLDLVPPSLRAEEPAFDAFWDATQKRRVVTFDYQRPGRAAPQAPPPAVGRGPQLRSLVRRGARRRPRRRAGLPALPRAGQGQRRPARPGRTTSRPAPTSRPSPPTWRRRTPDVEATVLVRQRAGVGAPPPRDAASRRTSPDRTARAAGTAWSLTGPGSDLAAEVLTYGPSVVVEAPEELRADVLARLQRHPRAAEAVR